MVRIRFGPDGLGRVRFASAPAPLAELNVALGMMTRRDDPVLFGRWRHRLLRALPVAAEPLADLVPCGTAPLFLDVFAESMEEGLATVRSAEPALVRSELDRVYAARPGPPPRWIQGLREGDAEAWALLSRAQRAAFEVAVRPVWDRIQDLHRDEFVRHALTVAQRGVGAALVDAVPGSRLRDGVWECAGTPERDIALDGRSLVLRPAFHWSGRPLVAARQEPDARREANARGEADDVVTVTYAAGPGPPLSAASPGTGDRLAEALGTTRAACLRLLADGHSTSALARRLGVSNATASAQVSALRRAGLASTERAGRAVLHRRTPLGDLLALPDGER